jgi:hypothetical protein
LADTPKYYIKGNLSEKQIEADVAAYMGWCTPPDEGNPFRLLDLNEQLTGADKLLDRGIAIYIQFKKSSGLKSVSLVKSSKRSRRSPLEDIREFRASHELDSDPTLFFQLRAKAKTALDLQHNILFGYERPPWSRAIYVAPLLLDKDAYHHALFESINRFMLYPFYYRFREAIKQRHWVSLFGAIPFLRQHISIAPHERVADHNHFYAYSEAGVDISWHSPDVISRDPSRLSDFTVKLFRDALENPDSMLSLEVLAKQTAEIGAAHGFPEAAFTGNEAPLQFLQRHSRWLRETHGIRQLVLLGNLSYLAELRHGI